MRYFIIVLAVIVLACSPKKSETIAASNPAFDSLLNRYYEGYLKLKPFEATAIGDDRYNDILYNPLAKEYQQQSKEFYSQYRDALRAIDRTALNENDQISYDALAWECDMALEALSFPEDLLPINQFWSVNLSIGQFATGQSIQPFKTAKDYRNWLSRLRTYVEWCDTAIYDMQKGMKAGYLLPKALAEKVVPQLKSLDHGPVSDHLFYLPVKSLPADLPDTTKAAITKEYTAMIEKQIIPAHRRLREFFEKVYVPASRKTAGISEIPNGKEYYQHLIKRYTTTSMSADEIFALGQREVERISKEMESVKEESGFKGDIKSYFAYLDTAKKYRPFTKPEEVIAHFNEIHERMKPNLAKLFNKTPKTPFEVRRTEAFREASASAEYTGGSEDGTRPGIFYVPIPDVKKYNIVNDEDLFLHEAIPGHHYQISLQQENKSLPKFRRILGYSAFGEGWALYTESLGKELGLYTDPAEYFGMLNGEMHRAIRLVVDAGMHSQGWTREQAIQYSRDHESRSEAAITAEIERYMAIPGQALSYKIGQLKIRELRERAERELGDKFNIGQFHDQILDGGNLPLHVLEGKINRWIDQQKKG